MRRIAKPCVGLALAAILLAASVRDVDLPTAARRLGGVRPACVLGILAVLAGIYGLRTLRWGLLLRPLGPLAARDVLLALLVGSGANCLLPGYLGEVVRASVLARRRGLRAAAILPTIAFERALDLAAVAGLLLAALAAIPACGAFSSFARGAVAIGGSALALLCLLSGLGLLLGRAGGRSRALGCLGETVRALGALRGRSGLLLQIPLALLQWSLNGLGLYLAALAVPGSPPIPILAGLILSAAVVFGGLVAPAPGHLGTMQIAYVVALGPFGVDGETAIAASLLALLAGNAPVAIASLWFLKGEALRPEGDASPFAGLRTTRSA